MMLSGTMQLDGLSLGTHTITGYVARSDNSKITGSDSATITFTMTAAAPPPVLSFSSPANNAVLNSSTVTVAFSSSGDLSQANHAHIIIDGVEVAMTSGVSGTTQLTVSAGAHTLGGYLARADHSKITGSDASAGQLHGDHRESERSVDRRPVGPDHRAVADGGGEPESDAHGAGAVLGRRFQLRAQLRRAVEPGEQRDHRRSESVLEHLLLGDTCTSPTAACSWRAATTRRTASWESPTATPSTP